MNARTHRNLINEGGDGYEMTDQREALVDAEIKARRAAWTVEVTTARRAAWNTEMATAKAEGRKINLQETETKMGFRFADLKAAIVRHKL